MRKLLLRYFVPATLILTLSNKCFSQFDSLQNIFYLKKLPPEGILLDKGWKFISGDNPVYAHPEYDDKKWRPINPTLDIHDLPQVTKPGIGWLRLHLSIDSNLLKEQLAIMIHQSGASEIYLNGRLLYRFGIVSTDPNEVKAYDPVDKPVSILFGKNITQVLAVRFTLQPHLLYTNEFARTNPLLEMGINQTDRFFEPYFHNVGQDLDFFRIGVFFILTILHLAFFLH